MRTTAIVRAFAVLVVIATPAESSEKKVKMVDLSPAVQKAVQDRNKELHLSAWHNAGLPYCGS